MQEIFDDITYELVRKYDGDFFHILHPKNYQWMTHDLIISWYNDSKILIDWTITAIYAWIIQTSKCIKFRKPRIQHRDTYIIFLCTPQINKICHRISQFFFLKMKHKRLWISNVEKSILDLFWNKIKLYSVTLFSLLYAFAIIILSC